jgi:anti-sigma regulatory factor (Ser/Thr protein kinase)
MDLTTTSISLRSAAKVPAARHKIHRLATAIVGPDVAEDVELMAAEAIANALLHGCGGASVTVAVVGRALRVEVRDQGPGFAVARRVDHGRGHTIIAALASRWEFVPSVNGAGTCLWFEVDLKVDL